MHHPRLPLGLLLAFFACLTLSGCGPATARLNGKVLLKGQPVPGAEIEFTPVNDATKNYRGISLADGKYQIDYGQAGGLPLGNYRVTVTFYQTTDGKPLPPGELGESLKNTPKAVQLRYALDLSVDRNTSAVDLNLDNAQLQPGG